MKLRGDTVVCGALFAALALVILLTHASGEGDSTLHFLNAREGVSQSWSVLLSSWSRPLFKALIVGPAWLGVVWARLFMATLATALGWVTIGLARDLNIARPWLAGPLLLAQPLTFFTAQNILTEIPAALALYGALRLWLHKRHALSCFVVSLIPAIRPEGYFFMALWGGLLVLEAWRQRSPRFVLQRGPLLGVGMVAWVLVCWFKLGVPLYPFKSFWPMGGWGYGSGHLWDYLGRWPWFMGAALFPLFLMGAFTSWRRELTMVWVLWWLVLGLHSILWWRGLFASAGLLRIMVVVAPSAALIALVGFNSAAAWLERKAVALRWRRALAVVLGVWALQNLASRYVTELDHQPGRVAWPAAEFIERERLLAPGTQFFSAHALMFIAVDYPRLAVERVPLKYQRETELELLKSLRPGAIGVWDNGSSNHWVGVTIDDIPALGYERLAEFSDTSEVANPWWLYAPWRGHQRSTLRYVVFRKREAPPSEEK